MEKSVERSNYSLQDSESTRSTRQTATVGIRKGIPVGD